MTQTAFTMLCGLLAGATSAQDVPLSGWNLIIQQGRSAQVLGILRARLESAGQFADVPESVRWHLDAANVVANKNYRDAIVEISQFLPVFKRLDIPLILLKGAAYLAIDASFARGRAFSDLDILVPEPRLEELEKALHFYGWNSSYHSKYDQKYYRQWMHELPPLKHNKRGTVLDIHHTILPLTARLKPPAQKLFDSAVPTKKFDGVWTLSPHDMILHAATHLFMDSEYNHAFRDLVDIDGLLRLYSDDAETFWQDLLARAEEMDLLPPLIYALRHVRRVFDTPVPDVVLRDCLQLWQPRLPVAQMDAWFERILRPPHSSCDLPGTRIAQSLFHVRGHYLRMPIRLLAYHLSRKAIVSPFEKENTSQT
ncbi:MAG: hypothetical protein DRR06_15355 [Gammaproteobacteria bacterium]|nr:MAG: hypothetical protein DRR06_15355 [Gammaproteobacteria bacterium]